MAWTHECGVVIHPYNLYALYVGKRHVFRGVNYYFESLDTAFDLTRGGDEEVDKNFDGQHCDISGEDAEAPPLFFLRGVDREVCPCPWVGR